MLAALWLINSGSHYGFGPGAWSGVVDFFAAAVTPALSYEAELPASPEWPLLVQALRAANLSLAISAAALSLAILCALPLSYFVVREQLDTSSRFRLKFSKLILGLCRILRTTHELIWAVVLLVVFGFSPLAAIIAIALTATGALTKIYSEILAETDSSAVAALKANGAPFSLQFLFGLLPIALADLIAYTLYQLECAVRSSAVMGVLGLPTLGYFILQSHENLYFSEVWTYIYTMVMLMVAVELWCRAICKRLRTNDHNLPI